MQRLPTLLLICLLTVALPLQAAAAALMPACRVSVSSPMDHASMDGPQAGHTLAHTACADLPEPAHSDGHHACGLCAACGWHATLPVLPVALTTVAVMAAFAPFVAQSPPVFLTTGIERPPRPASA